MNNKGMALIFIFIAITVLVTLGITLLSRSISENLLAQRYVSSTNSFWLAEAGVQKAIQALNTQDWTGWSIFGSNGRSITQNLGRGSFSVTIDDISSDNPQIVSSGNVSGTQRSIEVTLEKSSASPFNYAAFGTSSITMSGNGMTDSYDSSKGAYGGTNRGS
ncbi:MAG: hypothetical protein NC828_01680, partial [Candidatus Omnitrophica bacterium]|nr:hypothetical protein [Candidatus Omnitrophota bacterium]